MLVLIKTMKNPSCFEYMTTCYMSVYHLTLIITTLCQ